MDGAVLKRKKKWECLEMRTVNIKRILTGIGVTGALLLVSAAHATVVTDTYSEAFNFNSYDYQYDRDAVAGVDHRAKRVNTKTVSIARFDESLGTLLGVEISFDSEWSLTSTVNAYDTRSGNLTGTGKGKSVSNQQIRLIDPWREIATNNVVEKSNCRDKPSCRDTDSVTGSFNGDFDLGTFSLSDFIGTDMLDFKVVRTLKSDLLKCGFSDSCWQRNSNNAWGGNIHVAYTYNVPEPAGLALLGLGLAGLGVSRRKRKQA
jgi:hypothetical protein